MQETTLREVIRYFGSITKMAYKIGVSRTTIYRYLDGSSIPADVAFRIEAKSNGIFNLKNLIPWRTKYNLELDTFPSTLMNLQLKYIVIPEKIPYFIDQKNLSINDSRAICVDEKNHLIYGLESIESYRKQGKKTVLAWRLSLLDLQNGKYKIDNLKKTFDPIERTAIGIALEKYLGERRGRNNVGNFPHLKGIKTRVLIAKLLCLGDEKNFRNLKKILNSDKIELIKQVRKNELAISKAANLAKIF